MTGRYEVLEELGRGGMAVVYRARDRERGGEVALKVLAVQGAAAQDLIKRFQQEARATARLRHENIVSLIDVGEDGGRPFIAMELVPGGTLAEVLGRSPRGLPVTVALQYAEGIARALDFAHRHGIVHRDVKPVNVLMGADGTARLADFGIAKVLGQTTMTQTGMALGTPSYMAPEQAEGGRADARSDLYSLGIVLFELLCGRVPFQADTALAVLRMHVQQPAPPASALRPDVPQSVVQIIARCLEKDPQRRFASAADLAHALHTAARDLAPVPLPVRLLRRVTTLSPSGRRQLLLRSLTFLVPFLGVVGLLRGMIWLERVTRPNPVPTAVASASTGASNTPSEPATAAPTTPEEPHAFHLPVVGPTTAVKPSPVSTPTSSPSRLAQAASSPTHVSYAPVPIRQTSATPVPRTQATTSPSAPLPAATRPAPPADTWIDPKDGSPMKLIPAGDFFMGDLQGREDERPLHQVSLPSYYLDVHEVTTGQFKEFLKATGYQPEIGDWDMFGRVLGDHAPVVNVTWNDAQAYAKWVGRRLPTEAEMERAARGRDGYRYPWGNNWSDGMCNWGDLDPLTNKAGGKDGFDKAAPVGAVSEDVSPYGIVDLAGNVSNWTADWFQAYPGNMHSERYYGRVLRVIRGGSWDDRNPDDCRASRRRGLRPGQASPAVGFRTAKTP